MTRSGVRGGSKTGAVAVAVMLLALSGCARHKVRALVLPPFTPVELAQVPEPAEPQMVEGDDDEEDLPPVPVAEGASVPKRQRRRPAKPVTPAAPTVAAEAAPPTPSAADAASAEAASVIGELTPGGDQDPKTQQEAADLITANEKRLSALSAETLKTQSSLVSNVRNFQKQAQQALKGGDAGGAKTLAMKAKLLLDDLENS